VSSPTYSTVLDPEPSLRRLVILFGIIATVAGLATILVLSIPTVWRVSAVLAWLVFNGRELLLIAKCYERFQRIRIWHCGDAELLTSDGSWSPAALVSGSVVLRKYAWLRLKTPDGQRFGELLCGKCMQNEQWRRLQVIWRHLGAGG